jgi:hypothetical protein
MDKYAVALYLKGFLRTFGASESAYTFCEPADEVLRAHHNGDRPGSLEKKLIGRHQPGGVMATAESRCHHHHYYITIVHPVASGDLLFALLIKEQWLLSANAPSRLIKPAT